MKPCRCRWLFATIVLLCPAGWFLFPQHRMHSRLLSCCYWLTFCPSECAFCQKNNDWWTLGKGSMVCSQSLVPFSTYLGDSDLAGTQNGIRAISGAGHCVWDLPPADKVTWEFRPARWNLRLILAHGFVELRLRGSQQVKAVVQCCHKRL